MARRSSVVGRHDYPVPSALFGLIERAVRGLKKFTGRADVTTRRRDADADRYRTLGPRRPLDGAAESLAEHEGTLAGGFGQYDCEFLTAVTEQRIGHPEFGLQQMGNPA